MSNLNHPPKMATWLLKIALPSKLKNELSGDLLEEYQYMITQNQTEQNADIWFWQQTLIACFRTGLSQGRMNFVFLAMIPVAIFSLLFVSVIFLSSAEHSPLVDKLFAQTYWLDGNIHKVFFDPLYWQAMYSAKREMTMSFGMLFNNLPSTTWALFWLVSIYTLDRYQQLNAIQFATLSIIAICGLYIWGAISIATDENVQLRTVGPTIAYMWLSIFYLILPLGLGMIVRVRRAQGSYLQQSH